VYWVVLLVYYCTVVHIVNVIIMFWHFQAARRDKREDAEKSSFQMQQKILTNLIRSQALKEAYGLDKVPELANPTKSSSKGGGKDAIFELPPMPETSKV